MHQLIQQFCNDGDFQSLVSGLQGGLQEQVTAGLSGSARTVCIAAIYLTTKRPVLMITHNLSQAQKVVEDLQQFLPKDEVYLYPADELIVTEFAFASRESSAGRVEALSACAQGFRGILVVPYTGVRKLLLPVKTFRDNHIYLELGQSWKMEKLLTKLVHIGYQRVEQVEHPGEISVRGGIVDIFPVTFHQQSAGVVGLDFSYPLRVEWFDDEIDSIRPFNPMNQRSFAKWKEYVIPPAHEWFAPPEKLAETGRHLEKTYEERLDLVKDPQANERLREVVGDEIEQLKDGTSVRSLYKYISYIYPDHVNLLSYMPDNTILVFDEPNRINETARQIEIEEAEWFTTLLKQGEIIPETKLSYTLEDIKHNSSHPKVYLSLFLRQIPDTSVQNIVQLMSRSMQQFHGQMHVLKTEWDRWVKAGFKVIFTASTQERLERLVRTLSDYGMELSPFNIPQSGKPTAMMTTLQNGFEMIGIKLAVISENEVFTQKSRRKRRVAKSDHAEKIRHYQELKSGDYVVHVNHGIGRYLGIETLDAGGLHKDYLYIQYAKNDKLYVPVEQINHVQKYVGGEDRHPRIYKLGGSEWSKTKSKVKKSVADIAQDLIQLYAKRRQVEGYPFSTDTLYQQEFEAMFPYEETPDQLRSIIEIKNDMEQPQPMDRLLCGDVGYGKTEVAIRAAFKATLDGKQVALLVPTTILAQQHFETFRQRFADYPVNIRVLSRFRSRKEQKETLTDLKMGTVDIVIGTHRLLSKDILYQDLGLLIVDEEQRFGVKHKEKIKQLKHNIDVLSLSATPIPRTLHMSMVGVRDLSVIETPPKNRFPVQTYVLEYSDILIREAIERELSREGQVYLLYNYIQNIDRVAEQIRELVPDSRVAVAHGQMNENELEKVMLDFLDREYDVLVSTTIIETGVDIPNVNTLIIHDADKMGLSQLYQLRGRVGRSNRIAYAYFTYRPHKGLSEMAEKRLQAIKDFTDLGSGFKIAMRDLSIRGAGNLLGSEQHGHINTVGFELYSQMLKDAVSELKGESKTEEQREIQIDLKIDAYLPSEYIKDEHQKIECYKKIRAVKVLSEINDLEQELVDRFGDLPVPVENLVKIARIRNYAMQYGVNIIEQQGQFIYIKFLPEQNQRIDGTKLFAMSELFPGKIGFSSGQYTKITFKIRGIEERESLDMIEYFLSKYDAVLKEEGMIPSATND